jgi:type I restriction enzyme M protein
VKGGDTRRVWFDALRGHGEIDELPGHWPPGESAPSAAQARPEGFFVGRTQIAPPAYTLDVESYRQAQHEVVQEPQPHALLHEIATLEAEILQGIRDLVGLLK